MTRPLLDCVAKGRGCGTPTGWRNKGRCPACREAHNQETRERRRRQSAPSAEQVNALLAVTSQGVDLTEAARRLDIAPQTAAVVAATDPRFIASRGAASAKAGRQAAYLAALFQAHGEPSHAVEVAGIGTRILVSWREDGLFRAAEDAVRAFCADRLPNPRRTLVTPAKMSQILELVNAGSSLKAAALEVGVKPGAVHTRARTDPEFKQRLADADRRPYKKDVDEARLRELWFGDLPLKEVAQMLGVSPPTVRERAKGLGLGRKKRARR